MFIPKIVEEIEHRRKMVRLLGEAKVYYANALEEITEVNTRYRNLKQRIDTVKIAVQNLIV